MIPPKAFCLTIICTVVLIAGNDIILDQEGLIRVAKALHPANYEQPTKDEKSLICSACVSTINLFVTQYENNATLEEIMTEAKVICYGLGLFNKHTCDGAIENYAPELGYMLEMGQLSGRRFCGILFGKGCGDWETVNNWTLTIPSGKPPVETPTLPSQGSPRTKFLQLSDMHLDLTYTVGSTAMDCGEILCCTNATAMTNDTATQTKYWGGYRCDLPIWSFEDMLMHIKENHPDISYIILTGDYPAHDVWLQSREDNLGITTTGYNLVKGIFPDLPIYSSLGNHESFPCNSFPTSLEIDESLGSSWLYNGLSDLYSDYLEESAQDTLRQYGFYSTLVMPGFRIIAMNSNMCLSYNFWLSFNWVDPYDQLSWLADELLQAEANDEKVHIISHVPAGQADCLGAWGREYGRIIERFENTVVNHFYGHTHFDEYFLIYDEETNSRPVSVGFITPSVTTWTDLNPAYRIYTMDGPYDGASMRILNYETFIFNVSEANLIGENQSPRYYKLYNALEDLQMTGAFPSDYDDLARRLAVDDQLWTEYIRFYNQDVDMPLDRREVICKLVSSNSLDDRKCNEIMGPPM